MTHPFDRDYFNGGAKVGGYAYEGYWDYPVHWTTFYKIQALKPESVLEIGAARGYVLRRLEDAGVRVKGLEISEHCRLTRAIDNIVTWDITQAPWPVEDKSFDLCVSVAVLEHIPEDKLGVVFSEMARTCKRGLHGIDLHDDDHFDKTHVCIRPLQWWLARLPEGHVGVDKEDLERGEVPPQRGLVSDGVKLNLGCGLSQFGGWRNLDIVACDSARSMMIWDVRNGLPYEDNIVGFIYAGHLLEHLTYDEGARLLKECHRVLKPGGVLRVSVTDVRFIITHYHDLLYKLVGTLDRFDELDPAVARAPTKAGKLQALIGGRAAMYDAEAIEHALRAAGFQEMGPVSFRHSRSPVMQKETLDLQPDISLIFEAQK